MHRSSRVLCGLLIVVVSQFRDAPALAQPAASTAEEALREAVAARDAALRALEKANQAIEAASAALDRQQADKSAFSTPQQVTNLPDLCRVDANAPRDILNHAKDYAPSCLEKKRTIDIRITGVAQADKAAIVAAYTRRSLHSDGGGGRVHNTYHRFRLGFTQAKRDDRFPIFDFAGSQWLRGSGITGGYEFGRTFSRTADDARKSVADFLAEARRDCIAAKLAEPLLDPLKVSNSALQLRPPGDVKASCDGKNLSDWMGSEKDRRDKYYKAFNVAVFQPENARALYGGLNLSVSFPRFEYVPALNLPSSPVEGQPKKPDETSINPTTHEVRVYAGGYTSKHFALEAGLSHRRTFEESDKRTICPVGTAGFLECWNLRTEPPSELRGFVADARAALLIELTDLPSIGFLAMPSYEFDAKRWSANGSVYFAVDEDGKLSSGLSFRCRGRGESRSGKSLDKDCKAEVFVATAFTVRPKN